MSGLEKRVSLVGRRVVVLPRGVHLAVYVSPLSDESMASGKSEFEVVLRAEAATEEVAMVAMGDAFTELRKVFSE